MNALPFTAQLINVFAAVLLLLSFAMLAQRRILSLVDLLAWQGAALVGSTLAVAYSTGQQHLYYSAALTLALKVILVPLVLHRLIRRLAVRWDTEPLLNIPATMIVGLALVVFSFGLAQPISAAMRAANTCSAMTLSCCCTAWNLPIDLPNCARSLA